MLGLFGKPENTDTIFIKNLPTQTSTFFGNVSLFCYGKERHKRLKHTVFEYSPSGIAVQISLKSIPSVKRIPKSNSKN